MGSDSHVRQLKKVDAKMKMTVEAANRPSPLLAFEAGSTQAAYGRRFRNQREGDMSAVTGRSESPVGFSKEVADAFANNGNQNFETLRQPPRPKTADLDNFLEQRENNDRDFILSMYGPKNPT